ncbi:MAG: hypothetical protein IPJ31_15200 [Bacteroidetes bacterium]|nr:hypothetical protein [Bacteroidota bacterium]
MAALTVAESVKPPPAAFEQAGKPTATLLAGNPVKKPPAVLNPCITASVMAMIKSAVPCV